MSSNAPAHAEQAPQDVLAGIVERVTYHDEESGLCVLLFNVVTAGTA